MSQRTSLMPVVAIIQACRVIGKNTTLGLLSGEKKALLQAADTIEDMNISLAAPMRTAEVDAALAQARDCIEDHPLCSIHYWDVVADYIAQLEQAGGSGWQQGWIAGRDAAAAACENYREACEEEGFEKAAIAGKHCASWVRELNPPAPASTQTATDKGVG